MKETNLMKELAKPSRKDHSSTISVVHDICCGLDVHKKLISACLLYSDGAGAEQS
jgi:hypothetical protein